MIKMWEYLKTKEQCRKEASELQTELDKYLNVLGELNKFKNEIEEIVREKRKRIKKLKRRYKPYYC